MPFGTIAGNVSTRSGDYVVISGNLIATITVPTSIKTGSLLAVTSDSGGVQLSSGVVVSVVIKTLSGNSGDIYIGGSGAGSFPYSGYGYQLNAGQIVSFDMSNLYVPHVCAVVSGDVVTFMGIN